MNVEFDSKGNMVMKADDEDRVFLQTLKDEDPDRFGTDAFMYEYLEEFVVNNDYDWTRPEYCGALTSAPMLAIYGPERRIRKGENPDYMNVVGSWDGFTRVQPVKSAWAFMDYQMASVQAQLLETGQAFWQKG